MIATEGEYKGNNLIILKRREEDRYAFAFGLGKARLILEHIRDIEAFVEKYGDKNVEGTGKRKELGHGSDNVVDSEKSRGRGKPSATLQGDRGMPPVREVRAEKTGRKPPDRKKVRKDKNIQRQ